MDKQNVAYNRILFHHKKEWSINSSCNTDEPCKYDAKWKKPNIKGYTFYDSIYIKCLEWTQKVYYWLLGTEGRGNAEWLLKDIDLFWGVGGTDKNNLDY